MANYPMTRTTTGAYPPFNGLESALNKLTEVILKLGGILIGILVIPVCIDVFLRSFLNMSIDGVMEIETLALVLIAFSGMSYNMITRQPIQIDLFYNMFRSKTQVRLDLFSDVLCFIMSCVLAYQTFFSGIQHKAISQVLAIPESYFILWTSFTFGLFIVVFFFLILHVLKEMLEAKDYFGIFLSVSFAFLLCALPVLYRMSGLRLSGLFIGVLGFTILIALLLVRVPIGLAMSIIGVLGTVAIARNPWGAFSTLGTLPYRYTADFILVAMPMFMLMGEITYHSGLSRDLFDAANKWLGRLPGGLACASVGGCAGFGAVCGDSLATVVTMSSVALPAMREANYDPALATGALAAGGTLGILIPPSMGFIFYSIITEESISKLFIAGIMPGLLLAAIFMAIIAIQVIRKPEMAPKSPQYTMHEKLMSIVGLIPIALLFVLVVGGILQGFFTPGEGGAVGAMGAFLYALARRRITYNQLKQSLVSTAIMCGKIFLIFVGVYIFGNFLAASRLPNLLADTIIGLEVNRYLVLAFIVLIYIFLGCIMNILPMMMLTLPSIYPTVQALGFDGIWFGVVCVIVMEMGMITPPVGMNVFTMSSLATDIPMSTVFRGVMPFFFGMLICVLLVTLFPAIALWLPGIM